MAALLESLPSLDEVKAWEAQRWLIHPFEDDRGFVPLTFPGYVVGRHHRKLCEHLEAVERGQIRRLIVEMPPRMGKSELMSIRFPAWYLGRNPRKHIIACSYAASLAYSFSRQARNLVRDSLWPFGAVQLADDAQGVEEWLTNHGGGYVAAGVGGPITGHGADVFLIDDPLKNREEADSETVRESQWQWYTSTARTRLQPKASIVLTLCMTGDTPVLMADGTERPLREIKAGDQVATYDNGRLTTSIVRNHKSNGPDSVLRIRTISGTIVHANERHPFLVEEHGQIKWTRVRDLSTDHRIVTVKDNGASGKERLAPLRVATNRLAHGVIAPRTITKRCGQTGIVPHQLTPSPVEMHASNAIMGSPLLSTTHCSQHKMASALFAGNLQETMYAHTGVGSCALITATKPIRSERFCATTVISPWDTPRQRQLLSPLSSTSDFTTETIASIEPAGEQEVFDLQIDRTENFIANGLVSHNTRWHEDDLAGRLLKAAKQGGEHWETLVLPALATEGDPLGRAVGEPLWPEWFSAEDLDVTRRAIGSRDWSALYQQRPMSDEGAMFRRLWFQTVGEAPKGLRWVRYWDLAASTSDSGDYTAAAKCAFGPDGTLYVGDVTRGRWEWPEALAVFAGIARMEPGVVQGVEGIGVQRGFRQLLLREPSLRGVAIVDVPVLKDKQLRAAPWQARAESDKLRLVLAGWNGALIDEACSFPLGEHDDMVDAVSGAVGMLARSSGAVQSVKVQVG